MGKRPNPNPAFMGRERHQIGRFLMHYYDRCERTVKRLRPVRKQLREARQEGTLLYHQHRLCCLRDLLAQIAYTTDGPAEGEGDDDAG